MYRFDDDATRGFGPVSLVLASVALYLLAVLAFEDSVGIDVVAIGSFVPAAVAGFAFGPVGGLVGGLGSYLLNLVLYAVLHDRGLAFGVEAPSLIGHASCTAIAVVVGYQRQLTSRLRAVAQARDAAEQRAHEHERRLRSVQKMDAIGRLVGSLAHEFNTLLASIDGFTTQVLDTLAPDDPRRDDLGEVLDASHRGSEIVARLLPLATPIGPRPAELDLAHRLQQLEPSLRSLARGRELELDAADLVLSCVQPDAFDQVVTALVGNAAAATRSGQRIEVTLRAVQLPLEEPAHGDDPVSWLAEGLRPGWYAALQVSDTGRGIDPAIEDRIFEPLFTTDEGSRAGMGLSVAYGTVASSGGAVRFESEPGVGTTFVAYLPCDRPRARSGQPAPELEAVALDQQQATVIVAEDNVAMRKLIARTLRRGGHEVLPAEDGRAALELLSDHVDDVEVLVTDVRMPGMDGFELAGCMRAAVPGLPVIYTSGFAGHQDLPRASPVPEGRWLPKPFMPEDLLEAVAEVLADAGSADRAPVRDDGLPAPQLVAMRTVSSSSPECADPACDGAMHGSPAYAVDMGDSMGKLLVVEDDGVVTLELQRALQLLGYEIVGVVGSTDEAVVAAARLKPGLVLLHTAAARQARAGSAALEAELGVPVAVLERSVASVGAREACIWRDQMDERVEMCLGMSLQKHRLAGQLGEQSDWLSAVLCGVGAGVVGTDAQGCVTVMNQEAERLTGWPFDEARGRPVDHVFHTLDPTTQQPVRGPVGEILDGAPSAVASGRVLLVARDGSRRLVAGRATPIGGADEAARGIALVFRDVARDAELTAELGCMQRLQATELIAGGIAHDFNNMLGTVLMNLGLLQLGGLPDDERGEILDEARSACRRAVGLTRQLMTFSRGGAPSLGTTDLVALLEETATFALRGRPVRLIHRIDPDLWSVVADEGQLAQVITNLCLNAAEAMPEGGAVTLLADNVRTGAAGGLLGGTSVRIRVADQGCGIAAEHLERVFEPFYSSKQRGSGLGLSTARAIVDAHGGKLGISSSLGRGTVVTLHLPALEASAEPHVPDPTLGPIGGSARVLVMDDDPTLRIANERTLTRLGYVVATAQDGEQAIGMFSAARQAGHPFDLVLLDLTVPDGMGGIETLEQLRALDPTVAAVVCSGYETASELSHFRELGFRAALPKPVDVERLDEVLREVLAAGR